MSIIKMTAIVFLLSSVQFAQACSCARQPKYMETAVTRAFNQADAVVFAHTIKKEETSVFDEMNQEYAYDAEITQFSIIKSWKGALTTEVKTKIITACCMCGMSFSHSGSYLLYLYGPDDDGYYSTSICSRTKLTEDDDPEIHILDQISLN
ncbi:hypothetical protein [Marinicella sp. W31]|uniref:hypothetical protein n=1 Tax=Marinicella sp. W31 TaxID=3023713 RepID=UPI003758306D